MWLVESAVELKWFSGFLEPSLWCTLSLRTQDRRKGCKGKEVEMEGPFKMLLLDMIKINFRGSRLAAKQSVSFLCISHFFKFCQAKRQTHHESRWLEE